MVTEAPTRKVPESRRGPTVAQPAARQNEPLGQAAGPLTACPRVKVQAIEIPACQLISPPNISVKTQYVLSPAPFCTFTVNKDVCNTAVSIRLV